MKPIGRGLSEDELPASLGFLKGGGVATRLILARDWSAHPLGVPDRWPLPLKTSLSLVLNSPESMILSWNAADLFFFFNETYIPMLGPRVDWAMGAPFAEVWADGLEQAMPIINEAFAGVSRRFVDLPWKLDTDRGSADTWWSFSYSRILDERGEVAGLFIFTNETTERVLADRALAQSQAELRSLNESLERQVEERTGERDRMWNISPDLMVVVSPAGIYRRANPAWQTVLGYAPEEIVGLYVTDLIHPADLAATEAALATALAGTLPSFENRLRHKDGGYRWIQWVAAPGPHEIFAIGRHVTAAKEAEQRLRDTEDQLRQAQKMEAVGQLTGGIAHDFNNFLQGIAGNLNLLQKRLAQGRTEELDRFVNNAMASAHRAGALTHRLLAFSRRQPLDPRPVRINPLVAAMEELLRRTLKERIELELLCAGELWLTLCDAHQLESAILNLAINARDAMPRGGKLSIETSNARLEGFAPDTSHDVKPGHYVCICVRDTGTGMDPDVLARAFEPFFTTKPIGQGTGLGLSMIYGFARQSEGHARITSEPGRGTAVRIYLPRYLGSDETAVQHESSALAYSAQQGESVLVVEDDEVVRALIVEVVADLGYRALQAADGNAGAIILQSSCRIDLLITDMGLPGLNGRQVADAGRAVRPDLKVLFMTGYAENAALASGFLGPGMAMITKPFAVEALIGRISEAMKGSADRLA